MTLVNYAAQANGGSIVVSSAQAGYPAAAAIDGVRAVGATRDAGGSWHAGISPTTANPALATVIFPAPVIVSQIKLFGLRAPTSDYAEPTATETTPYPNAAFTVRGFNGSAWVVLATVTGNNLAQNVISGGGATYTKIEVSITAGAACLDEFEVWGETVPPPVILNSSPLPIAVVGKSYSVQLQKTGGSGSGNWGYPVQGNMPNGSISAATGLISIAVVGTSNYTFTVRFADSNGSYTDKAFTIPVANLDVITLCHKRPLNVKYIEKLRYFEPISGAEEVIEDAAQKREFTMMILWIGGAKGDEMRQFLYDHRKRKPFIWVNPDRANETTIVKMVSEYSEAQMLAYGDFEIVLREV